MSVLGEIRAACRFQDTKFPPGGPTIGRPVNGLLCLDCEVGWQRHEDGDDCWVCGAPGT